MTTAIDKEELIELLGLCMKEHFETTSANSLANKIVAILPISFDCPELISPILNNVGKALLNACEHIK